MTLKEKQIMEANKQVSVCGSRSESTDEGKGTPGWFSRIVGSTVVRIVSLNVVALLCITCIASISLSGMRGFHHDFVRFTNSTMIKHMALKDLISATGYGGTIHHIKNYVLRGDERYYEQYQIASAKAHQALDDYRAVGETTAEEERSLKKVEEMLNAYDGAIQEAYKLNGIRSSNEIDDVVRITDEEYIDAISDLRDRLNDELGALGAQIQTQVAEMRHNTIVMVVFSILLLGGVGTYMAVRVARRAKELAEIAEKQREANELKSNFLANMSHEIRSPMTSIVGYAELLERDGEMVHDDEQRHEALHAIRSNADHLLAIINDILDLSKIEAGKLSLQPVHCSPLEIIDEVITLLQHRAKRKGLSMTVRADTRIPEFIRTDEIRLRQILINLLSNALKFTEVGGVTIGLCCDPALETMRITVEDTGIGMTPEQVEIVSKFELFTQLDNSNSRSFGGTGLGLRISNTLAQMLGGRLEIESVSGRGSSFSVVIATGSLSRIRMMRPEEIGSQSYYKELSKRVQSETDASDRLDGMRVLLAEDIPSNQALIRYTLEQAGAELVIVNNGQEAVNNYSKVVQARQGYDVILMDMQMPVLDGYRATTRLREMRCNIPIIAITAHAMTDDREKCLAAGCDEHLTKPIDFNRLVSICKQKSRRPGQQAA